MSAEPIMAVRSPRGARHRYGVDESVSFEIVDSKGDVRFVVLDRILN